MTRRWQCMALLAAGALLAACGGGQRATLQALSGNAPPQASAGDQSGAAPQNGSDNAAPAPGAPVPGGAAAVPGATNTQPGGGASLPAARQPSGISPNQGRAGGPLPPVGVPGQNSQGAPGNPNSDVGVTASSIKVGHVGIYSGPVGYVGQNLSLAARATLQWINDNGGINGRKLDVLVRDSGWDGTKGLNATRDLVERQGVFALCCIEDVSTTDAITPYADQQKVPNLGGDGWTTLQYTGQWTYPMGVPTASEARVLAKYQAQKQGVRSAAILHLNNVAGQQFRDAYKETLERFGGHVDIVQPATFDDPGTTTLLARARTSNVDTVVVYADSGIVARLVREAASQGYKPPKGFAGSAMYYFNITPQLTGPAGEGLISESHWTPHDENTPGLQKYRQVVEHYYPNIDHTAWTVTAYMAANLFGETLKKLGLNVTRQRFKDELDRVTDFDLGLGSKITFRPGNHHSNTTVHLVHLVRQGDQLKWQNLDEYWERDTTYDH